MKLLKPLALACLPFAAAGTCLAWTPADVNIVFSSTNAIDYAIVLPELGYYDDWFADEGYGPFGAGVNTVNYQNPDYQADGFELMGVDTEADGSLGFFVAVPAQDVIDVSGKSFADVFPGFDESEVINGFLAGVNGFGGFNDGTAADMMYDYENTYSLSANYGQLDLYSFSSGTYIGTANFTNPSAPTPAPFAAAPFALGLLQRVRRRRK